MQSIAFKMLFRRKGIASTILAIALLIALLASVNSLVNNINSQSDTLTRLAGTGKTYLIVNQNSTSLLDSKLDPTITERINHISGVQNVITQKLLQATLTTASGSYSVSLRGIDNVTAFFKTIRSGVSGTYCTNGSQANIGSILSNIVSVNRNDSVTLSTGDNSIETQIVGIVQSQTQSDTEIILPLKTADALTGNTGTVNFIEFSLKALTNQTKTVSMVSQILPTNYRVIGTQQVNTFAQDINAQVVSFLNLWSIAIYAVVIAASYIIATRLITEAKFELAMFRTLGAKKGFIITLVFSHTIVVAFLGSVLGLAMGIAGAQVASTAVRWLWGNLLLSPFLNAGQALQIILLALASATIGCLYPALKSARNISVENSP